MIANRNFVHFMKFTLFNNKWTAVKKYGIDFSRNSIMLETQLSYFFHWKSCRIVLKDARLEVLVELEAAENIFSKLVGLFNFYN